MAETGPSEWWVNSVLAATFLKQGFVIPGVYLQLHTGPPGPAGTANVLADTDRQPANFGTPADGIIQITGAPPEYLIGDPGGPTATVSYGSLWTQLTGGTWFWNVSAIAPFTVVEGDLVTLSDGATFRLNGWV